MTFFSLHKWYKKIGITVCLLCIFLFAPAQNIDSLKDILSTHPDNVDKLVLYEKLLDQVVFSNPEEGILYGSLMLDLAEKLNVVEKQQKVNFLLGNAYAQQSRFETAKKYYEVALSFFEGKDTPTIEKAKLLNNLGLIYSNLNDFPQALSFFRQSLAIKEQLGEGYEKTIAATLNNIGLNYQNMEDYENATHFYLKALGIRKELGDKKDIASSYSNLGGIYFWLRNYEQALDYYNLSINVLDNSKYNLKLLNAYAGKGETFMMVAQYDSAGIYIQKAYEIADLLENTRSLSKMWKLRGQNELLQGNNTLAEAYFSKVFELNDTSLIAAETYIFLGDILKESESLQAKKYYERAISLGKQLSSLESTKDALLKLSTLYRGQRDFESAYQYFAEYKIIHDSLFNQQSYNHLQELKIRHEAQQKEFAIKQLQQKHQQQQKHLSQQRRWFLAIIIMLLLVASIIFLWGTKNRKTRLHLQTIQEKEEELNRQKKNHANEKIKMQSQDLMTKAMLLHEKNEQIAKSVEQLNAYKKYMPLEVRKRYQEVLSELKNSQSPDSWKAFEMYFSETHQDFYEKLLKQFPDLTPGEKKLCAFLRLNLTTKEIASLLHLSPKSVEVSRSRLRKKLKLTNTNQSLVAFLSNF